MAEHFQFSRRQLLRLAALSPAIYLSSGAQSANAESAPPWAMGWNDIPSTAYQAQSHLPVSGAVPKTLSGTLFRNGPGFFRRAGRTVSHWFDGDGLVQRFDLSGGQLSHAYKLLDTPKRLIEDREQRFLFSSFATRIEDGLRLQTPDDINVANKNVLWAGEKLYALWEGGSALEVDPRTLRSLGFKVWKPGLESMPFSAHPKKEPDGSIWNFGQDVTSQNLIIYHLHANGSLNSHWIVDDVPGGFIHDFCITQNSLIFFVSSLRAVRLDETYLGRFEWQPDTPQQIIILSKSDPTSRRTLDIPPGFQFHFGNAFEDKTGTIHLSYCAGDETFLLKTAKQVMCGTQFDIPYSRLRKLLIHRDKRVELDPFEIDIEGQEFPQYRLDQMGMKTRFVYCIAGATKAQPIGSKILKIDQDTKSVEIFDFGPGVLVEEHLFVPCSRGKTEDDGWLIGTALDTRNQTTVFTVFNARALSDGPICQFDLGTPLPLGFHGVWKRA